MILAVDVQYTDSKGIVAGVLFDNWCSKESSSEYLSTVDKVEEYQSGEFFRRELPCIVKLLEEHSLSPDIVIVDGYVFLDGEKTPGLGKYLHDAMLSKCIVVGVAKKAYSEIGAEFQVFRGSSKNPLYVTSIGQDVSLAKENILSMHGEHRLPTLLKRVDRLCREETNKSVHA